MRFDADYIVPFILMLVFGIFFVGLFFIVITEDNKEKELCKEYGLEFLGLLYDENGKSNDYCGELKNGMLVKKYKIINDKYLEDAIDSGRIRK